MSLRLYPITLLVLALRAGAADSTPVPAAIKTPADAAWSVYRGLTALEENHPDFGERGNAGAWVRYFYTAKLAVTERFFTEFPDDPRHWDAEMEFSLTVEEMNDRATSAQVAKGKELHDKLKTAPGVPMAVQSRIWAHDIFPEAMKALAKTNDQPSLALARAKIDELANRFPQVEWLGFLEQSYYAALEKLDPTAASERLKVMLASSNAKVAEAGRIIAKVNQARTHPLEMKFTALDGREVDLANFRRRAGAPESGPGKVVLVDFWATWCGPCKEEIPHVLAAYEKYHGRGFEVVSISLDSAKDRQKLADFVRDHRMPWPQYFDGKGWENQFAVQYGIHSIPTTWLLDKNGLLVAQDLRDDELDRKVGDLLK